MKLVVTVVVDVDSTEEASSEYVAMEENWVIVSARLNGEDFHPQLVEGED